MLRKLPLGIHTFSLLRKDNCLYIDKTRHAYNLITQGYRYFLSRPRRFGKSLFISTLKEILTGNKSLFEELWIAQSDYQWPEYGVIALDFSYAAGKDVDDFNIKLKHMLINIAKNYQVTIDTTSNKPEIIFDNLVKALYARFGRVAFLVDEYDSPILRMLPDHDQAQSMRKAVQQFFTAIKSLDAEINFIFITGVSSFTRAGLFSGINNLTLLTLDKNYAAICGYTDGEIDQNLSEYISSWAQQENIPYDQIREKIKIWYNGYRFGNKVVPIYNPFSLMHAFNIREFNNFWFQSGAPTFLIEILKKEYTQFNPDELVMTQDALGIFDVGATPLLALMFQTGYLTIVDYDPNTELYTLNYPNLEVKKSFQKYLLEVFAHLDAVSAARLSSQLYRALNEQNIEKAITLIRQLFVHIPYQLHMPEEKFYHALLTMVCVGAGIKAQSEYSISHGRIDMVLELPTIFYVIEIKFNKPVEEAMQQIEERRYYERFLNQSKPIILLGLSFERAPEHFDVKYMMKQI